MLQVENTTRKQPLITNGRMADNSWTRLRGLIGVRHLAAGEGLLIKPCKGVHCMFMSIPIDVIYVNKNDQIIAIDTAMKPWAIGKIYKECRYVLELPANSVSATNSAVGDQLWVIVNR